LRRVVERDFIAVQVAHAGRSITVHADGTPVRMAVVASGTGEKGSVQAFEETALKL
jgi:hypothetical protein